MKCKSCGKEIKSQEEQKALQAEAVKSGKRWSYYSGSYCDGILTYDSDPFAEEIHGDFSKSWDCEGSRHKSLMDI